MDSDLPSLDLPTAFPHEKWRWLRVTVRAVIEQRSDAAEVKLTVADLTQPERDVLRWLLRIAEFPTDTLKVRIRRLDAALTERTDARMVTRALLEALDGCLDDHRGDRRRTRSDADELWQRITVRAAALDEPRLLPFLEA